MRIFVDSNIPMYVAGKEHPNREPSRRFLEAVGKGQHVAVTSTEVLQEILYRYAALGRRELGREVYELFVQLCAEVLPVTVADTDRAKALVCDGAKISVRDAVHAAVMRNNDLVHIATFDSGFDHLKGIRRLALPKA